MCHHRHGREHGARHSPGVPARGRWVVGCDVAAEPAVEDGRDSSRHGCRMVSLHPSRISDPPECARLVEFAVSEFDRIDVLFNLAAKSHFSPLESFTTRSGMAPVGDEVDLVFYLPVPRGPLEDSGGVI